MHIDAHNYESDVGQQDSLYTGCRVRTWHIRVFAYSSDAGTTTAPTVLDMQCLMNSPSLAAAAPQERREVDIREVRRKTWNYSYNDYFLP